MSLHALIWSFSGALVGSILTAIVMPITINWIVDRFIINLGSKSIRRNALNSYLFHLTHLPVLKLINVARRAQTGQPLLEPSGSGAHRSSLSSVNLNPAPLAVQPVRNWDSVDIHTIIGPQCRRPMHLISPLLLDLPSGDLELSPQILMAYERAAEECQLPLLTSGQNYLPDRSDQLPSVIPSITSSIILNDRLSSAAMTVIQVGVAGNPGSEWYTSANPALNYFPVYQPHFWNWKQQEEFTRLVMELKEFTEGAPVAVRMVPGASLERDLQWCITCGIDAVILESSESESLLSPEVVAAHFGIPLLAALARSTLYLQKTQDSSLSILASGSMWGASDYLKALALGCSAVLIGQPALWAVLHKQLKKVVPWQPLGDFYLVGGAKAGKLKPEEAAVSLANYIQATQAELSMGIAATGKYRVSELGFSDLVTTDSLVAHHTGIALALASASKQSSPAPNHDELE